MSEPVRATGDIAPNHRQARTCRGRMSWLLFSLLAIPCAYVVGVLYAAVIRELIGPFEIYAHQVYLFWTWSEFLHLNSPRLIYDPHLLHAFETSRIVASAHYLPFAYPPSMLLLIWPLALLSPVTGVMTWLAVSLAAILWAGWHRNVDRVWSYGSALFALAAPSTLTALYFGQVSLLVSACLIGGWRSIDRRPVLAGVLFGLGSVKPQLGFLIPIALVSAGRWQTTFAALLTVGLTVLASGLAFGWSTWTGLPAAFASLSHQLVQTPEFNSNCPSVSAALRLIGVGPTVASAAQAVATIGVATAVWFTFRRGITPLAVALVMAATFLAVPYDVFYDLQMLSYAVLLVISGHRDDLSRLTSVEIAVLILSVALPILMTLRIWDFPWGGLVPAALFALILRRIAVSARACTMTSVTCLLLGPQ